MTGFSSDDAKRVGRATVWVEKHIQRPKSLSPHGKVITNNGLYIKVSDKDSSSDTFSWVAQEADSSGAFSDNTAWGEGDQTGQFAKDVCGYVQDGQIVFARFAPGQEHLVITPGCGGVLPAKTDGTVSARSGNTPGSGSVTLRLFDGTALSDGETVTIYNNFTSSVDNTVDVMVAWSPQNNNWWLIGEDC